MSNQNPSARSSSFRRFFEVLGESSWSLVKLNFLFLISCVPLFTAGPAMAALSACIQELVEGELPEERPFHSYWTYFLSIFRTALPWGFLTLAANGVLFTALFFYGKLAGENGLFVVLTALSLLGLIFLWGFLIHLFPLLSKETAEDLPRLAALTALERMRKTLIALLISTVLLCVQLLFLPVTLPLLLSLGIVLPALICGLAHTEGPEDLNSPGHSGENL